MAVWRPSGLIGPFLARDNTREPFGLLFYGLVYQDQNLPHFEDLFGCTYIFKKLMMSSMC